jgi:hypothetical protein
MDVRQENGPDGNQGPTLEFDKTKVHDTTLRGQEPPIRDNDTPTETTSQTHTKTASNEFKFVSISEMLEAPLKTDWIIKPFLDAESMAITFGEPGSMKSFFAIDIGLCIASGLDWHGFPVGKQGPVFYIAGEGHKGLIRRYKAWGIEHGVDISSIPFFTSTEAAQILDAVSAKQVADSVKNLAENHGDPILVILDTLNRNFGPGNENETSDMTRFIALIDCLIRIPYGCSVIIIHHSGHNDKGRARGNSALLAAADFGYRLEKKKSGFVELTNTKVKDHDIPPNITFKPKSVELKGWIDDEDGKVMTSCVLQRIDTPPEENRNKPLSRANKIALESLVNILKKEESNITDKYGGIHIENWRQEAYKYKISTSDLQNSLQKAFDRAIESLLELKLIEKNGDYYRPVQDTGQEQDKPGTCPRRIPS